MSAVGKRLLQLTIAGVPYTGEVGRCVISTAESKYPRLSSPQTLDYFLNLGLVVDHAPGSLWRLAYDMTGLTAEIVYRPYGNTAPSSTQPHYTATGTIVMPVGDLMGSEAKAHPQARQTVEVTWPLFGKPTPITEGA